MYKEILEKLNSTFKDEEIAIIVDLLMMIDLKRSGKLVLQELLNSLEERKPVESAAWLKQENGAFFSNYFN